MSSNEPLLHIVKYFHNDFAQILTRSSWTAGLVRDDEVDFFQTLGKWDPSI